MSRPSNPIPIHRIGFVLEEPLYNRLKELADNDKRSISTAIRMILEAALAGQQPIVGGKINGGYKA